MLRHACLTIWILAYLASRAVAVEKPADFARFWRQAMLQAQSLPPNATWADDSLSFAGPRLVPCQFRCHLEPQSDLPPILYLLDRTDVGAFTPNPTHSWVIVDVGALWSQGQVGPEPTRHPMYAAVLTARRALELMLQRSRPAHVRAGVVGEGRGGGVALALAALYDRVAFVAAHEPMPGPRQEVPSPELRQAEATYAAFHRELPQCLAYFDLNSFAPMVKCPTLVSFGGRDTVVSQDEVFALYDAMACEKELAEFPRAGHCQTADLQEWWETWRAWAGEMVQG